MKTSLVVGMGIGNLYANVLNELGYGVITVDLDPAKDADFLTVDDAIKECRMFDTVHICTPNFTHIKLARKLAPVSGIVFIEKPGVATSEAWAQLVKDYPSTRFQMVKNNQFRDEIKQFKELADLSERVTIRWSNRDRIPNPGSWFTDKSLAFGGVSRDLLPHMLSYYCTLTNYTAGRTEKMLAEQRWQLKEINSTDYGVVNPNGVYNVDDFSELMYINGNTKWTLSANWRSMEDDDIGISFIVNGNAIKFELGLCPESAYKKMIETAVENLNNNKYWEEQLAQDIWIHKQIENL